jgi:hypothetical protein
LEEEFNETKQALMLNNKELEELRDSHASLKEEFEEAKMRVTVFETENSELQNLIKDNDDALLKVQNELENTLKKVSVSDEKQKEYKARISSQTQKLDTSSVPEGKNSSEHYQETEVHILAKQAELEDLQEEFMRLQKENAKQKESIHQQRKQLTEMQNSLIAKQKACADLRDKIKSDMDINQDKVSTLKREITEISAALSNERLLNEDLRGTLESTKRHAAAVEEALKKTRLQKSELECQIHQEGNGIYSEGFSKSHADTEAENTALRNTLKQLQDALYNNGLEFEEQLSALKASNKEDIEKMNKAEKENERLKNIIDEKQGKCGPFFID